MLIEILLSINYFKWSCLKLGSDTNNVFWFRHCGTDQKTGGGGGRLKDGEILCGREEHGKD